MMSHPDFVTHYHSVRDTPFRNLSDLALADLDATVAGLMDRRRNDPSYKRVFGRKYMDLRRRTEAKLRALFIEAGGRPQRAAPHYFVLGSSPWFADLYPDTCEVRVPLTALDDATTSITYPDGFVAMRLGAEFGLPVGPMRPYHDRVYRIGELEELISTYGMPQGEGIQHEGYEQSEFEVYVWSDQPINDYLP